MGSDSLNINLNRSESSNSSVDFEFNCNYTNMPESPRLIPNSPNPYRDMPAKTTLFNLCTDAKDHFMLDDHPLNSDEHGNTLNHEVVSDTHASSVNPELSEPEMISDVHQIKGELNYLHYNDNYQLQSWSAPETPVNQSNRSLTQSPKNHQLQTSLSDTEESFKEAIRRNYHHQINLSTSVRVYTEMKILRKQCLCKMTKWEGLIKKRMLRSPKWNKPKQSSTESKIGKDSLTVTGRAAKEVSRDEAQINMNTTGSQFPPVQCNTSCRTLRFLGTCLGADHHRCSKPIHYMANLIS